SICAASRASLFTSLHERTHGYTFGTPPISQEHQNASYPALLKAAGYQTGFVGKFGVNFADGRRATDEILFDFYRPLNRNPYFKKLYSLDRLSRYVLKKERTVRVAKSRSSFR
ncbi:MAG: sulfatase-like hydrolase/transferase, partial [Verrucomicrobiota bacterium]